LNAWNIRLIQEMDLSLAPTANISIRNVGLHVMQASSCLGPK